MNTQALPLDTGGPLAAGTSTGTARTRTAREQLLEMVVAVQRYWRRNRSIRDLQRLPDRQLEDLGFTRDQIPLVVNGLMDKR